MSAYLSKYVVTLKSIRTMDNFFNDDELVIKFQIVVTATAAALLLQHKMLHMTFTLFELHIFCLFIHNRIIREQLFHQ